MRNTLPEDASRNDQHDEPYDQEAPMYDDQYDEDERGFI